MSSIRSRRRWIRIQLVIVTVLVIVVLFPSSPRTVRRAIAQAPIYQKIVAMVEEAYVKRKIENGNVEMRFMLAFMYYSEQGSDRYVVGDPETVLLPLVEDGNLQAIRALSMIYRSSDPEKATDFSLRAADMGDYQSQMTYMRRTGYELSDPESFVQKLFELQKDRPGWKTSFNRTFRMLQDQAEDGNEDARKLLDSLTDVIAQTGV